MKGRKFGLILDVAAAAVTIFLAYLLHLFVSFGGEVFPMEHSAALLSGVGFWILGLGMLSIGNKASWLPRKSRGISTLQYIVKCSMAPVAMCLFFNSLLLMMDGAGALPQGQRLPGLLYLVQVMLVPLFVYGLSLFLRYEVEDGTFVIQNGRLYNPGDEYMIWPFMAAGRFQVFRLHEPIDTGWLEIKTTDGPLKVQAISELSWIPWNLTKDRLSRFDLEAGSKQAKLQLQQAVEERAVGMNSAQLLKSQITPEDRFVQGIPISWRPARIFCTSV